MWEKVLAGKGVGRKRELCKKAWFNWRDSVAFKSTALEKIFGTLKSRSPNTRLYSEMIRDT